MKKTNKASDFLSEILGNPVRARVLRLFVGTPHGCFTLDDVVRRTQSSRAAVSREMKALQKMGIVRGERCEREAKGRDGMARVTKAPGWSAHVQGDHFKLLASLVRDTEPAAEDSVLGKLKGAGDVKIVVASGFFTESENPSRIDLLIVGDKLNERKVATALRVVEAEHGREIAYALFSTKEFAYRMEIYDRLIRDVLDYPHRVLLDKTRVL